MPVSELSFHAEALREARVHFAKKLFTSTMITVYLWLPPIVFSSALSRLFSKDVGHAALQIGSEYISFYPCDGEKMWNPFTPIGSYALPSLNQEKKPLHRAHRIAITGLDEAAMLAYWHSIQQIPYCVLHSNCCTVVGRLLLSGFRPESTIERIVLSIAPLSQATFWEPINLLRFAHNLADVTTARQLRAKSKPLGKHSLLIPLALRQSLKQLKTPQF